MYDSPVSWPDSFNPFLSSALQSIQTPYLNFASRRFSTKLLWLHGSSCLCNGSLIPSPSLLASPFWRAEPRFPYHFVRRIPCKPRFRSAGSTCPLDPACSCDSSGTALGPASLAAVVRNFCWGSFRPSTAVLLSVANQGFLLGGPGFFLGLRVALCRAICSSNF